MMAKGCIVAGVLSLRCFLFLLPNYTNILVLSFLFALCSSLPEGSKCMRKMHNDLNAICLTFCLVINLILFKNNKAENIVLDAWCQSQEISIIHPGV